MPRGPGIDTGSGHAEHCELVDDVDLRTGAQIFAGDANRATSGGNDCTDAHLFLRP
jgi:hypothetical protein